MKKLALLLGFVFALIAAAALPFIAQKPDRPTAEFQAFLTRLDAAQLELQNGKAEAFKGLWSRADDVTLSGGFGGNIEKGWTNVGTRLDWVGKQFSKGTNTIERLVTNQIGTLAYVIQLEHIGFIVPETGTAAARDYRVTMIFRRESGGWRIVHRQADSNMTKQAPRKLMARKPSVITRTIAVDDLDAAIDAYTRVHGYKLEMITPADSPTVAVVSGGGIELRLESSEPRVTDNGRWVTGRAGMEYRDLIPGRLDGKVIASHIRIPNGGEVADYVHYHKVRFQMIYCVAGAIRVVYEDQGEPFWLVPGDCVLQPPEIRHRVLEAAANSEVVEIGSPAVHETWADHDLTLPTGRVVADREFSGQQFLHYIAADSKWKRDEFAGFEASDTGMHAASNGMAEVYRLRSITGNIWSPQGRTESILLLYFVIKGSLKVRSEKLGEQKFIAGESVALPTDIDYEMQSPTNSEILCVVI